MGTLPELDTGSVNIQLGAQCTRNCCGLVSVNIQPFSV